MILNILALGDVVGPASVEKIQKNLWKIRREMNIHFVVANGENSALGGGIDIKSAKSLTDSGVDVITTGNHTFKRREIREYLDDNSTIIRPANFPNEVSGNGYTLINANGFRFLVMNVMGLVFMDPLACPFRTTEKILKNAPEYDVSILDIHAESTSEKIALSLYFDGKIDIMFGTHTHVQTSDVRVMKNGSGYITDLGMCGPDDSVLGIKKEKIFERLITHMPTKFDVAETNVTLHGAVFSYDTDKKMTVKAELFEY